MLTVLYQHQKVVSKVFSTKKKGPFLAAETPFNQFMPGDLFDESRLHPANFLK